MNLVSGYRKPCYSVEASFNQSATFENAPKVYSSTQEDSSLISKGSQEVANRFQTVKPSNNTGLCQPTRTIHMASDDCLTGIGSLPMPGVVCISMEYR
jgi:hypothetical protein